MKTTLPVSPLATAAVLLIPGSGLAQMDCTALGAHLAAQPYVFHVSATTPLTSLIGSRCEANFI